MCCEDKDSQFHHSLIPTSPAGTLPPSLQHGCWTLRFQCELSGPRVRISKRWYRHPGFAPRSCGPAAPGACRPGIPRMAEAPARSGPVRPHRHGGASRSSRSFRRAFAGRSAGRRARCLHADCRESSRRRPRPENWMRAAGHAAQRQTIRQNAANRLHRKPGHEVVAGCSLKAGAHEQESPQGRQ